MKASEFLKRSGFEITKPRMNFLNGLAKRQEKPYEAGIVIELLSTIANNQLSVDKFFQGMDEVK